MKSVRSILREAKKNDDDGDCLANYALIRQNCSRIEYLEKLLGKIGAAFLAWGPTDDGAREGLLLEDLLTQANFFNKKKNVAKARR